MASILDAINAGIKVADSVTRQGKLQCTVLYRHYVSEDGFGGKIYNPSADQPALEMLAIVDWRQKQVRTLQGTLSVSRAYVGFLNAAELSAATDGEGIDDNDIIILPDGTTGPILDMSGFIDSVTTHGVITEVYLG